ncbi:class I SAM-dependent methyltransferase [Kribbella sp. NPDC051587]|uniref:class I SAM-dependent methyltransferase n=1 Tax=Kribbella sp. NPDC051587 TaxID=3364119 RepID=UPI0037874E85
MTTDYDTFADAYSRANETGLLNAYYNQPAMIGLAGEIDGHRVLDAGCGSGPLTAALRDRGAVVTGFDQSQAMIDLAQQRLGADADLRVADLADPFPFDDDTFDEVLASLCLHYLEDWTAPLAELRRVLKPGGRLILSVPHPSAYLVNYPDRDYFAVTKYSETFDFAGHEGTLTYRHRPLHAMTDAFTQAGFQLRVVSEPPYATDTPREILPPELEGRKAFVCFLFFVLEA